MVKYHLLLCIHGLGGSSTDFACLSQSIMNYFSKQKINNTCGENIEFETYSLKCNERKLTHIGLELMGKKMVLELEEWLQNFEKRFQTQSTYSYQNEYEEGSKNNKESNDEYTENIENTVIIENKENNHYQQNINQFNNQQNNYQNHQNNINSPNIHNKKNVQLMNVEKKGESPYKKPEKIILSVICHSLGGLVARSGFKEMFFGEKSSLFLEKFHCGSFITMCTPHLGTRHPGGGKHVHMIGKALFRQGARFACKNLMGKTGLELYLKDAPKIEETILYQMSDPDSDYMKALKLFKIHSLIGSTRHDHIVPYCSATIRPSNPHRKPPKARPSKCRVASISGFKEDEPTFQKILHFLGHKDYVIEKIEEFSPDNIINNSGPFSGKKQSSGWYRDNLRHSKFNADMMKNLQNVPWRRISFEFQLPSVFNHTNAHCLCLGSWFTGSREDMTTAGIDAVRLIMMLVYMDHVRLVNEIFNVELKGDVHLDDESSLSCSPGCSPGSSSSIASTCSDEGYYFDHNGVSKHLYLESEIDISDNLNNININNNNKNIEKPKLRDDSLSRTLSQRELRRFKNIQSMDKLVVLPEFPLEDSLSSYMNLDFQMMDSDHEDSSIPSEKIISKFNLPNDLNLSFL